MFITTCMLVVEEDPRVIQSGQNKLTCLEDTTVVLRDQQFMCRALENIQLETSQKLWQIKLGGKEKL